MLMLNQNETCSEVQDRLFFKLVQFNVDENYWKRVVEQGNYAEEGAENKGLVGVLFCTQENAQKFVGAPIKYTSFNTIDDVLDFVSSEKELKDDGAYVLHDMNLSQKLKIKPEKLLFEMYPDMETEDYEDHVIKRLPNDFTFVKGGTNPGTKSDAFIESGTVGINGNSYIIKQTPYNQSGLGKVGKSGKSGLEMEFYLKSGQEAVDDFYFDKGKKIVGVLKTYEFDNEKEEVKLKNKYLVKPSELSAYILDDKHMILYKVIEESNEPIKQEIVCGSILEELITV